MVTSNPGFIDTKSLLLSSKDLNATLKYELFRDISWDFRDTTKMWFDDDFKATIVRNGHSLASIVRQNSAIAASIQRITLHYGPCDFCNPHESVARGRGCVHFAGNFLGKLIGLKYLRLQNDYKMAAPALPPNLESLHLGMSTYSAANVLEFAIVNRVLSLPKLKSLTIGQTNVTGQDSQMPAYGTGSAPTALVAAGNQGPATSNLTRLILQETLINADAFTTLLGSIRTLTSFTFTRSHQNMPCGESPGAVQYGHSGCLRLQDLDKALQQASNSLEHVKIEHMSRSRWESDQSILDFSGYKLKKLCIDPSMLIGRRGCDAHITTAGVSNTRLPSALASLLPKGTLEELEILLDLEQAATVPGYREHMVQSILSSRPEFPALRRILFIEDKLTQGRARCRCWRSSDEGGCPASMDDMLSFLNGGGSFYPHMNAEQSVRWAQFENNFRKQGIELLLTRS